MFIPTKAVAFSCFVSSVEESAVVKTSTFKSFQDQLPRLIILSVSHGMLSRQVSKQRRYHEAITPKIKSRSWNHLLDKHLCLAVIKQRAPIHTSEHNTVEFSVHSYCKGNGLFDGIINCWAQCASSCILSTTLRGRRGKVQIHIDAILTFKLLVIGS